MSWKEEALRLQEAMNKDNADPSGEQINLNREIWKWYADIIHKVVLVSFTDYMGTFSLVSFDLRSISLGTTCY